MGGAVFPNRGGPPRVRGQGRRTRPPRRRHLPRALTRQPIRPRRTHHRTTPLRLGHLQAPETVALRLPHPGHRRPRPRRPNTPPRTKNSPTRWRFRPPSPGTFRIQPCGGPRKASGPGFNLIALRGRRIRDGRPSLQPGHAFAARACRSLRRYRSAGPPCGVPNCVLPANRADQRSERNFWHPTRVVSASRGPFVRLFPRRRNETS
jgi:hypothetical protein